MITTEEASTAIATSKAEGVPSTLGSNLGGLPVIESEEELEKIIGNPTEKKENKTEKQEPNKKDNPAPKKPEDIELPHNENEEEDDGDGEKKVTEYPSTVHYINDKFGFKLNLEEFKDGISPEQEAEVISSLIERMTQGVNERIQEYQFIDELMEDEEVKMLIEAKANGKSLRDLAPQFIESVEGKSDEQLVRDHFKKTFPKSSDKAIEGMVSNLKSGNEFNDFATQLREQLAEEKKTIDKKNIEAAKEKQRLEAEKEQENIQKFSARVNSFNVLYGVPLTDQMKKDVISSVTRRDQNGLTYLEKALQSDDGMMLAAMGILHMKELIANGSSMTANKRNKKFIEKVFDSPKDLQSGASASNEKDEFDPSIANRF